MWVARDARGCGLRRRGPLGFGGELSARAGLRRGASRGADWRRHGQTPAKGRGPWLFSLVPGQGSQAQGQRKELACGLWGFGPGAPDVGRWTLRSGVEQVPGAGEWGEGGRAAEAFVPRLGKGRPRVGRLGVGRIRS